MARAIALTCIVCIIAIPCPGQGSGGALRKGDRVALRIPPIAFVSVTSGFRTWRANVSLADSLILVNGRADWQSSGFVDPRALAIVGFEADPAGGLLRVRLRRSQRYHRDDFDVVLPLADTASVLARLMRPAADSAEVRFDSYAAVGHRMFGALEEPIPARVQVLILSAVDSLLQGDSVNLSVSGGKTYLVIPVPRADDDPVFSEEATTESQRIAAMLRKAVLPVVTAVVSGASELPASFVVGISFGVLSKKFENAYLPTHRQEMVLYVPGDVAARFAHGALRIQELRNASVLVVAGRHYTDP